MKKKTGKTILRSTAIREVDGIKVGFIGMTLEATPDIVTQSGIKGLRFDDEVETANALVPTLKQRGAEAIVVLVHEGGLPTDPTAYDECTGVSGPIIDIAENLDPEIDTVVSGHTHQPYNCTVRDPDGRLRSLTSASSFGRIVTDIHLLLDRVDRRRGPPGRVRAEPDRHPHGARGPDDDRPDRRSTATWSRRSPTRSSATPTGRSPRRPPTRTARATPRSAT